ncbi:hypothetical protein VTG60DRAFT_3440 [Thermothelomyces hinnuleus]
MQRRLLAPPPVSGEFRPTWHGRRGSRDRSAPQWARSAGICMDRSRETKERVSASPALGESSNPRSSNPGQGQGRSRLMSNRLYSTSQPPNGLHPAVHPEDCIQETFQSQAAPAFHSARNDGARFFNLPYFPIEPFPGLCQRGGQQANRFPAISRMGVLRRKCCYLCQENPPPPPLFDARFQFAHGRYGRAAAASAVVDG